jgi:hypothetical protein
MPTPTIKIDNQSDAFATIVKVDFGDRLGELLDTVRHSAHVFRSLHRSHSRQSCMTLCSAVTT